MNRLILILCLSMVFVFAESTPSSQGYIEKLVSKYKKDQNKNQGADDPKGTADDGYLEKDKNQEKSPPKQTVKTKKVVSKQSRQVKNVIPKGAKVVHLRASLSVKVPKNKYVILDFPFMITSFDFKGLKSATPQAKTSILDLPSEEIKDKMDSPIDFEQKGNRIIINSKVAGTGQMIVWGGNYPVIVDLSIEKSGTDYYSFVDTTTSNDRSEVKKLENKEHQKVLNILSVALYRDSVPKGYEKIEDREVLNYPKEKIQLVKAYTLAGKFYIAEKWFVLNKDAKKPLNLYEEMFYMPDVYSVSILADRVEPKKSTAIYVVRKKENQ